MHHHVKTGMDTHPLGQMIKKAADGAKTEPVQPINPYRIAARNAKPIRPSNSAADGGAADFMASFTSSLSKNLTKAQQELEKAMAEARK